MSISRSDYAKNHTELVKDSDRINPALYNEYGVKSGFRNKEGSGILAGLTNISKIIAKKYRRHDGAVSWRTLVSQPRN